MHRRPGGPEHDEPRWLDGGGNSVAALYGADLSPGAAWIEKGIR